MHLVLLLLLPLGDSPADRASSTEAEVFRPKARPTSYFGLWVSYFVPSFAIDETINIETAYGQLPVHFFTSGFRQTLGWGFIGYAIPGRPGLGGGFTLFGHHSTGHLNWEARDLGISFPPNRCDVTECGLTIDATPSVTMGPVSLSVFAGGALALSLFSITFADTAETGSVYMFAIDCGARAMVRIVRSLGITAGFTTYIPWVWGCSVEPGVIFHPRYLPHEVSLGFCWS